MRIVIVLFFLFCFNFIFSQSFNLSQNSQLLERVIRGSVKFADIDGDNDLDLLITGRDTNLLRATRLYKNDGSGTFNLNQQSSLIPVDLSSVAFADIDNDNDQDLLITGRDIFDGKVSKLYKNDGSGVFTEIPSPFEGVFFGSLAFTDVDGDNDQDVFITGENLFNERISKLYINDGDGIFEESSNNFFDGVRLGSIAFADIDGDNDQDLLITGQNSTDERISKLYRNDGSGIFTEILSPFEGLYFGSVGFADIDGDNDNDVLITGSNMSNSVASRLYINDGTGAFSELQNHNIEDVSFSSIAFADLDGDEDNDILITGKSPFGSRVSKLYINDGGGEFTLKDNTPFTGVELSSVAIADIDGDSDNDLLITGWAGGLPDTGYITELFINSTITTSVNELRLRPDYKIYPNPSTDGRINIKLNGVEVDREVFLKIYDTFGKEVYSHKGVIGQKDIFINLSLENGCYFIRLYDGTSISTKKIIIN